MVQALLQNVLFRLRSLRAACTARRLAVALVAAACLGAVGVTAVKVFTLRDEELVASERRRVDELLRRLAEAEARHGQSTTAQRDAVDLQAKYAAKYAAKHAAELAAVERQRRAADEQHAAELAAIKRQHGQANAQHATELDALRKQLAESEAQHAAKLDALRKQLTESEARHAAELNALQKRLAESDAKHAAALAASQDELTKLRERAAKADRDLAAANEALKQANLALDQSKQALQQANASLADLQNRETRRRLSPKEKAQLTAALRSHPGPRVKVVATYGDEDAKLFAEDVAQALVAAGWRLDPKEPVASRRWDRSPVGIEITLNEADARADRFSAGVGALINALRSLGLVDGNTVYINPEVPSGEVELRVGGRLRTDPAASPSAGPRPADSKR